MLSDSLDLLPPDPLFGLFREFLADPRAEKVNLGIGVYSDPAGRPFVFETVKKVARSLDFSNFNYDPIGGNPEFVERAGKFLFGAAAGNLEFAAQQTCGGTHALALFRELARILGVNRIALGTPTWANHAGIFGDCEIVEFPHLANGEPSFANYEKAVDELPPKSILLIHGGATHNPTGRNLAAAKFARLAGKINSREIFVLVDFAYLGLGDGLDADRKFAIELFEQFENCAIALSFSKNASLYRHRLGALFVKSGAGESAVASHLQKIIRRTVSNLPGFGAEIMARILADDFENWRDELEKMRLDLVDRREKLVAKLPPRFANLRDGRGLFGLLGIAGNEVERLKKEFAIYLPNSARINFGGLPKNEIDRIAENIATVVEK